MSAQAATVTQIPTPDNHRELARRVTKGESAVVDKATGEADVLAQDLIVGLFRTIESQARKIGSLDRQLQEEGRTESHPQHKEIQALWDRYVLATGKKTAKFGQPRKKMVMARIRDGFPITTDEAQPSLELAIDGLASHPYRVFDRREREGKKSNLDNDFDAAMKDEKHVEQLSRLGWKARAAGWTPEEGWPA